MDQMLRFLIPHFHTGYQQSFEIFYFMLPWITLFLCLLLFILAFYTHSNNFFSVCVGISAACVCTKIWYGQLWHHKICAHSIHIKYICVPYVVCCIFVEIFFTMYVNSHLSLKKIDYSIMFQTEKCQNSDLPLDICINTGSVSLLLSCVLSNDKYVYTCMTYDKSKNINHKNDHDMLFKCKALDINSIQYHLIHIRITHHSNMHFDFEMYMIIITSCIKNMTTCSTLPIL